mgnify:CR=1 FL=1
MKFIYKILFVVLVFSALNARISDRHQGFDPLNPSLAKQSESSQKSFESGNTDDNDSVKWKRRHKRRKKARRPKRGR